MTFYAIQTKHICYVVVDGGRTVVVVACELLPSLNE